MISVRVNSEDRPVGEDTTVHDLLENMGFDVSRVAVEINGLICPKARFQERMLEDGDKLEVVSFVGGG